MAGRFSTAEAEAETSPNSGWRSSSIRTSAAGRNRHGGRTIEATEAVRLVNALAKLVRQTAAEIC